MLKQIKELKNDSIDNLDYGEFIEILKDLDRDLKNLLITNDKKLKLLNSVVLLYTFPNSEFVRPTIDYSKLTNESNRNNLINILITLYGNEFYNTEEFNNIFKNCYGMKTQSNNIINKPNSIIDARNMLYLLFEVANYKTNTIDKNKASFIISAFGKELEFNMRYVVTSGVKLSKTSKAIESILNSCNKSQLINIDNLEEIREIINQNISFINSNENTMIETKTGDYLVEFINKYNTTITSINEEKEFDKAVRSYYRTLKKTKYDNLDMSLYPKYEDPNFLRLMKEILNKMENNILTMEARDENTENACKVHAASTMVYAHYYARNKSN